MSVLGVPAGWVVGFALFTFFGTLVLIPVFVVRMRADYFASEEPPDDSFRHRHPVLRWTARVLKNLLGASLVAMGAVMVFVPGQGTLTMLVGLMLLEFPGKRRLERRLVCIPVVHRSIDWMRSRAGSEPLVLPECPPAGAARGG
jgi:hypothetical protein